MLCAHKAAASCTVRGVRAGAGLSPRLSPPHLLLWRADTSCRATTGSSLWAEAGLTVKAGAGGGRRRGGGSSRAHSREHSLLGSEPFENRVKAEKKGHPLVQIGSQVSRGSLQTADPQGAEAKPEASLPDSRNCQHCLPLADCQRGFTHRTSWPQLRKPRRGSRFLDY